MRGSGASPGGVRRAAAALVSAIDTFTEGCGRLVAWCAPALVLVTFAVVVLRYAFDLGWIALQESALYLFALLFLLGAAYTLRHDEHVRVDNFSHRLGARGRAVVDLLGSLLLLLPMSLFIFWISWEYVALSWELREGSREAGGLPGVFLLKGAILLLAATLALQGVAQLLRSLLTLTTPREES